MAASNAVHLVLKNYDVPVSSLFVAFSEVAPVVVFLGKPVNEDSIYHYNEQFRITLISIIQKP